MNLFTVGDPIFEEKVNAGAQALVEKARGKGATVPTAVWRGAQASARAVLEAARRIDDAASPVDA